MSPGLMKASVFSEEEELQPQPPTPAFMILHCVHLTPSVINNAATLLL